jgi:hypothetical protein
MAGKAQESVGHTWEGLPTLPKRGTHGTHVGRVADVAEGRMWKIGKSRIIINV